MTRPAAEGIAPGHFPGPPVEAGHIEPCPRRIRARTAEGWILDTTDAFYVWEHPYYPQYAVPAGTLKGEPAENLPGYVVVHFDSADEWYEEDERVQGHPRNPYVRVDALRSHRTVTVTHESTIIARSTNPVAVFETGLPPRWYLDPTDVDWSYLTPSDTTTLCPYKGVADGYWNAFGHSDVAWSYSSPTVQRLAGLISFDDARVDVSLVV